MVRGKFRLTRITRLYYNTTANELHFEAVQNDGTPENQRFHKYTPQGSLTMVVDNPSALEKFVLGEAYYLDFTPVPVPVKE